MGNEIWELEIEISFWCWNVRVSLGLVRCHWIIKCPDGVCTSWTLTKLPTKSVSLRRPNIPCVLQSDSRYKHRWIGAHRAHQNRGDYRRPIFFHFSTHKCKIMRVPMLPKDIPAPKRKRRSIGSKVYSSPMYRQSVHFWPHADLDAPISIRIYGAFSPTQCPFIFDSFS